MFPKRIWHKELIYRFTPYTAVFHNAGCVTLCQKATKDQWPSAVSEIFPSKCLRYAKFCLIFLFSMFFEPKHEGNCTHILYSFNCSCFYSIFRRIFLSDWLWLFMIWFRIITHFVLHILWCQVPDSVFNYHHSNISHCDLAFKTHSQFLCHDMFTSWTRISRFFFL